MAKTVAAVVKLIDNFSNPSKQVAKAARDMEKRISHTGQVFKNFGAIFESAGSSLTHAFTLPIATAAGAAGKFAMDAEDAYVQLAAATGTSAAEMEKYQDVINDIYKENFGESIGDVSNSLAQVNQNLKGLDTSALQQSTEYALAMRDVFGVDVAESTRSADTLMKNFGISSKEAFNLMTQGAQSGLNFSDELYDNLNEYSVQFKKLGLNAEDMFSIYSSGAEAGAWNLDKIGDAIKEFSIRSIDGSNTTAEGFKLLGLNSDDMAARIAAGGDSASKAFDQTIQALAGMEDPVKQSAAGVALFGTMWEDLSPQVVTSLTTSRNEIDKTKDAADALAETKFDTFSSALGGLWRTIQVDVLQPIGDMLIPYVDSVK
ncbi:phage tail tape measure protein [Zhenpiania hominis]|uniref:Phage tail tape measure protein n=1 Tax=Zhenpiania hominis TaxID=2763644 RepID=A0A923STD3_9FIRM|nr:phage tail tape measure protein [Zhenpiania hominis]MBC6681314.1 phage tail tape measure protein [Zhenpiania hominis]